jgi:prolipoprotein diacylglyceryl transferase
VLASIPSPTQSVWHLGPLPIRAYALCIVAGIFVAIWLTDRRWRARGGSAHEVGDIAGWAVLFGIVGGRLYHVITSYELYFGAGKHPLDALKIYEGGLGIWGAISLGAVGAWIGCKRKGVRLVDFIDAAAPGVVFAQALGRLGNWFNNELYGKATTLPWKLQIHCIDVNVGTAQTCPNGDLVLGYFHPTFLYELIWDLALGFVLLYVGRRWKLRNGQLFAVYMMGYTLGRAWIEALRIDEANHILGLRLNLWTCAVVYVAGLVLFVARRGGRPLEAGVYVDGRTTPTADASASAADSSDASEPSADVDGADAALPDPQAEPRPPAQIQAPAQIQPPAQPQSTYYAGPQQPHWSDLPVTGPSSGVDRDATENV